MGSFQSVVLREAKTAWKDQHYSTDFLLTESYSGEAERMYAINTETANSKVRVPAGKFHSVILIGVVSSRSGGSIRAIRLYETKGILDPPCAMGNAESIRRRLLKFYDAPKGAKTRFSLKDMLSLRTGHRSGLDAHRFVRAVGSRKTQLAAMDSRLQLKVKALETLALEVASPEFCQQRSTLPAEPKISEVCEPAH